VTGNKRELQASGNLTGGRDHVSGQRRADRVRADFTAKVPELTVADATITATHAMPRSSGSPARTSTKSTRRRRTRRSRSSFDGTAKQPQRQLGVRRLARVASRSSGGASQRGSPLDTQGQSWQLAQGSEATINYANDAGRGEEPRARQQRSATLQATARLASRATR